MAEHVLDGFWASLKPQGGRVGKQRACREARCSPDHSCFIFGISSHFKCMQWGLQMAPRYVSVVMETHFSLQTTG